MKIILYDCEICGSMHPWNWDGDCRDDENRYDGEEDYAERNGVSVNDVDVRSMENRVDADNDPNYERRYSHPS